MIVSFYIAWSLLYFPGGEPKVVMSNITTKAECARVAKRVGMSDGNFACVETKVPIYAPIGK